MEHPLHAPERTGIFRSIPPLLLILSNLLPLYGVLQWGWQMQSIVLLYWLESAVVGVYAVGKLIVGTRLFSIIVVPFFIIHYGGFMRVHLFLIEAFFLERNDLNGSAFAVVFDILRDPRMLSAVMGFFISHGISFVLNFLGKKEYRGKTGGQQMALPYKRIFVMHLTIIFGGFFALAVPGTIAPLLIMVALKIGADVNAHLKEHRAAYSLLPGRGPDMRRRWIYF